MKYQLFLVKDTTIIKQRFASLKEFEADKARYKFKSGSILELDSGIFAYWEEADANPLDCTYFVYICNHDGSKKYEKWTCSYETFFNFTLSIRTTLDNIRMF